MLDPALTIIFIFIFKKESLKFDLKSRNSTWELVPMEGRGVLLETVGTSSKPAGII